MIHLHNLVTRELPASVTATPAMLTLLSETLAALPDELLPWTEIVLVQPGDREKDLTLALGGSPLVDPVNGHRWPDPLFQPAWDWIVHRPGAFQFSLSFGADFGVIVLVECAGGVMPRLLEMCAEYAADSA